MKFFILLATCLPLLAQSPAVLLFGGSTQFPPQPSEMMLWLKADSITANTNGAAVTNWVDQSGKNHNFTNTAARSPFLTNNVVNGLPAVRFYGSSVLRIALENVQGFMGAASAGEIFAVMRSMANPGVAGAACPWYFGNVGNSGDSAHPFTDSKLYESFGSKASRAAVAITNISLPTAWHVYNVAAATNYTLMRYNGNIIGGNDFVNSGFSNKFYIGGNANDGSPSSYNGEFAEILLYSNVLTATSREAIHAYFATKYGIAQTNTMDTYTPASFSGLAGWWRPSNLASNNGDAVAFIPDESGRGWNATNNSITQKPTFTVNAFGTASGVLFNGLSNRFYLSNFITTPSGTGLTMIAVHQPTANTRVLFSATTGNNQHRINEGAVNAMLFYNGASASSQTFSQTTNSSKMVAFQREPGNLVTFWMNATNQQNVSGSIGTVNIDLLGSQTGNDGVAYKGLIGEWIIYTNFLPMDAVTKLYYTYARSRYALP